MRCVIIVDGQPSCGLIFITFTWPKHLPCGPQLGVCVESCSLRICVMNMRPLDTVFVGDPWMQFLGITRDIIADQFARGLL